MDSQTVSSDPPTGIIDRISFGFALLAGLMMLSVALFMSYEAFSRHFLDRPSSWVFAISILIFIWSTFLSVPYGIKLDKHVACDVFVVRLDTHSRQAVGVATDLLSLVFICVLGLYGFGYFLEAVEFKFMSEGLFRYPMWFVLLAIPTGMALSGLQTIKKIQTRFLWIKENPLKSSHQ